MVKRHTKSPVGAHYGTGDWLLQRLTAAVMALFTIGMIACIGYHTPASYADWQALFARSLVRVSTMLFFVALLYHAWVGVRDIIMDYAKPAGLRLILELGVGLMLLFYLIWSALILWR
jgi:succinate dehydrogenase / fumarate reductase membrane anchor subunit